MDKVFGLLVLTALAACPLAALLLTLNAVFGWRWAEAAVPYVFGASVACVLAAIVVTMAEVING